MAKEDIEQDPQLTFATTQQLIDELGKRSRGLLVVMTSPTKGRGEDFTVETFRRNALYTEAIGLARFAEQRLYDTMVGRKVEG